MSENAYTESGAFESSELDMAYEDLNEARKKLRLIVDELRGMRLAIDQLIVHYGEPI